MTALDDHVAAITGTAAALVEARADALTAAERHHEGRLDDDGLTAAQGRLTAAEDEHRHAVQAACDGIAYLRHRSMQWEPSWQRLRTLDLERTYAAMIVSAGADEPPSWLTSLDEWDDAPPDDTEAEGWPVATRDDIAAVLDGSYEPIVPTVLERTDGACLLYAGRVNTLAGEPGGGKTWVALAACAQQLHAGHVAALIDFEDRLDTAVRRLAALGTPRDAILDRFRYITPTIGYRKGRPPTNVVDVAGDAAIVVVDSMGEALAHSELNQNDDREVRAWMDACARRLADGGAAVLVLDHVTKDSEHRGRWAIGSQRKLAAVDGVAWMMETTQAATREQAGRAVLTCSKDRLGNYQHGTKVAEIHIEPDGDDVVVRIDEHREVTTESGEKLLTGYMERITEWLLLTGDECSARAIEQGVKGKGEHIRTALRQLIEMGYVDTEKAPRGGVIHRLIRPFVESEVLTASRVPTASPPRPGRGQIDRVPASPPLQGDADAVDDGGVPQEPARPASQAPTQPDPAAAFLAAFLAATDPDPDQEPTP